MARSAASTAEPNALAQRATAEKSAGVDCTPALSTTGCRFDCMPAMAPAEATFASTGHWGVDMRMGPFREKDRGEGGRV